MLIFGLSASTSTGFHASVVGQAPSGSPVSYFWFPLLSCDNTREHEDPIDTVWAVAITLRTTPRLALLEPLNRTCRNG